MAALKPQLSCAQVVYILDQVRALESEMLENLKLQGLDFKPQIVIVCCNTLHLGSNNVFFFYALHLQTKKMAECFGLLVMLVVAKLMTGYLAFISAYTTYS